MDSSSLNTNVAMENQMQTHKQQSKRNNLKRSHQKFDSLDRKNLIGNCLSVLFVMILQNNPVRCDYECGINRFNNESPLTERIVGGNNSLQ